MHCTIAVQYRTEDLSVFPYCYSSAKSPNFAREEFFYTGYYNSAKTKFYLLLIISTKHILYKYKLCTHYVCRRGSDYDDYEDVGNIVMDGHDHDMAQHHHQTAETASAGGAATTPQRSPSASGSNRPAGAGSRGDGTGQAGGKQNKGASATGLGNQQQSSSSGGGRSQGAGGRLDVGVGKGAGGREEGGVGKGAGVVFPEKSVVPTGGIDFSGCEQDPETGGWRTWKEERNMERTWIQTVTLS